MDNRYNVNTEEKDLDEDKALLVLAKTLLEQGAIRKTRYLDTESFTNEIGIPVDKIMVRYDIHVNELEPIPGMEG